MRVPLIFLGLIFCLLVVAVLAATIGAYPIALVDLQSALFSEASRGSVARTVLLNIRLPRIVAAGLVGAALSAAGGAYQCVFRNALVSPDILGVSTGAGLGAVLGILLGLPVVAIEMLGFGGGLMTVAIVMLIARSLRSGADVLIIILAGIVVGAVAAAGTALVKVLADPYDQLPAITFWLLGSLAGIRLADLFVVAPLVLIGLCPLILLRWRIGVLALGEESARALGIDTGRLRMIVIASSTLVTASVVAVCGVVGWVGLMVPHMARLLVGPRFDRLLPAALLLGASFMIAVDTLARSMARIEVPLGVLTAVIGGPIFVWLLSVTRRGAISS